VTTSLAWSDVENITRGELGRMVRTPCPICSHARRKKRDKCFAVTLKEPDFAIYNCVHCGESGYVHPDRPSHHVIDLAERRRQRERADRADREDRQKRTESALQIWNERKPFFGSPAETYLRITRNIGNWLDLFDLDQVLGFHPNCPFGNERLPCMLGLVRHIISNEPQAIHRTALKLGATASPDTVERIGRMSLGPTKHGAIKLSPNDEVSTGIMIGEGIETTLSASRIFRFRPAWSVISKEGVRDFPVLSGIECVTVAVDNEPSGDGQRAADELVRRQNAAGVEVRTRKPRAVKDFNDILLGKTK
jgi:putative DNA primase/helicase